jgi:ubiquinone biosynthesis protein
MTATGFGRLMRRLDTLSLDVARDVGAVVRDARALHTAATSYAVTAATYYRATPRAASLARAVGTLAAKHRWLRLRSAARGDVGLSADDHRDLARRATAELAALRGGAAKLGQLAACRPDLVGAVWAGELAALHDDVPALPVDAIRARIAEELGEPVDTAFASFDDAPLAAASLAQVHAAELHDGTRVVVKVQVPGIEHAIEADIATLHALAAARLPGLDLATIADELAVALRRELDYAAEADALDGFAASGTPCVIPRPIRARSSARVLTMTRIDGVSIDAALDAAPLAERDRLVAALVGELAAQVFTRGLVHGDPHPGNVLVTPDGALALLDLGCVLRLTRDERVGYAMLVAAAATGDVTAVKTQLDRLGFRAADPNALADLAAAMLAALRPGADATAFDWQAAVGDQIARARALGAIEIPPSFVLVGRALAAITGVVARHPPAVQLHAIVAPHLAQALR